MKDDNMVVEKKWFDQQYADVHKNKSRWLDDRHKSFPREKIKNKLFIKLKNKSLILSQF